MANAKHTTGPWAAVTRTTFNGEDATEISSGDDTVAICTNYSVADAALIDAAPELLAALRELVSQVVGYQECNGDKGFVLTEALASIAKAGGAA